MPEFTTLSHQPEFPNEDIQDANVPFIEYYLREENGELSYAESLRASLRMVYITGFNALRLLGIEVDDSQREYEAFCNGFAAFEYISLLVNPREYDGTLAVKNTRELLLEPGDMADIDMANRHTTWPQVFPNVYGLIIDGGAAHNETMKQLHSRTIAAQIACELQMSA